jgi:hypothetical protein
LQAEFVRRAALLDAPWRRVFPGHPGRHQPSCQDRSG